MRPTLCLALACLASIAKARGEIDSWHPTTGKPLPEASDSDA